MSDPENPVACRNHGTTPATYVCQHLAREQGVGYVPAHEPDDDDPWPDAWCLACDEVFAARGEWTDSAEEIASIVLLCAHCYEEARDRNLTN